MVKQTNANLRGLSLLVAVLGVLILLATTALVVLVIKKSDRGKNSANSNDKKIIKEIIDNQLPNSRYLTSYAVGDSVMLVVKNEKNQTLLLLIEPTTAQIISRLTLSP